MFCDNKILHENINVCGALAKLLLLLPNYGKVRHWGEGRGRFNISNLQVCIPGLLRLLLEF